MRRLALDRARASITDSNPVREASIRKLFDKLCRLPLSDKLAERDGKYDSQSLVFFARQLEQVLTEVEKEEFAELRMADGDMIPIDTSLDEGAETYTYYLYSSAGVARFLAAYSGRSLPNVTIKAARVTGNVEPFGIAYSWTARDIRNAQFANVPLETEMAVGAKRAHMELLNTTGLWGREDLGLPGLLNHPNITVADAPLNTGATSTLWINKVGDEIVADVNTVINSVDEISFGIEKVNRVEIARPEFNLIKTTRMTTGGSSDNLSLTILEHLQRIHPEVEFKALNELTVAGSEGNLTTNAMFAYTAGNRRKASLQVPMMFKQYPVQEEGLSFTVPTESSTGGVKMVAPLMCFRMEGIG